MPAISIIVPVYNVEQYLNQCLDSILSQTFTDFECILVDDYSPDNSSGICDEYAKIDSRIKVIHNKNNVGASLSRKIGLENSNGTYIQFIDSDDWIENDMIEKLYKKSISENYDMTVCDCFLEKNGIKEIIKQEFSGFDKTAVIKDILSFRVRTYLCNKLVKKDLYLLAEFPEDSCGEDYVITIQNVCNSKKIGYINEPLYNYRYNAQSVTKNINSRIIIRIEENRNWRIVIKLLKEQYNDLEIFEPELSDRLNSLRYTYMRNKDLRNMDELKKLFALYPGKNIYYWIISKKVGMIAKRIRCFKRKR